MALLFTDMLEWTLMRFCQIVSNVATFPCLCSTDYCISKTELGQEMT